MRKSLILLFFYCSLTLSGANYYVSPTGNDSNSGTLIQPFFTLNKAWTVISAGDIVYMRGGTYLYGSTQNLSGKNGTSGNLINVWAYPGETPVISLGSGFSYSGSFRPLIYFSGNYVHFKGITITGNTQTSGSEINPGMFIYATNNCTFELLNVHHNGMGIWLNDNINGSNSNNNLFLNCDIHHNEDPLTNGAPYGNADGIGININAGNTCTIRGCRFWYNSDDGIDPYGSDATIIIDKCWAFYNGLEMDTFNWQSDANGIKYGGTNSDHGNTILYYTTNCISYRNGWIGYNANGALAAIAAYNNISALNGTDGNRPASKGFQFNDPAGIAHIMKNNISYNDQNVNSISSNSTVSNNTFLINGNNNSACPLTSADFASLDASGLTSARQADGSLPSIDFLHLAPASRLIDAGVDVGIPFGGKAPDIGAFETQAGSTVTIPVYISSVIENATPSLLEMTYNTNLANIVPASSSFSVLVNSAARTVNSVTISGTKVQLTLASEIKFGDIVTASYTKPAANPLQTASGGVATTISAQSIVNKLINTTKEESLITITMTISPNHVHKIMNVLLAYSNTPSTALSPEIIRITDLSGKIYIEKLLVTGVTNIRIPINLKSGIYYVLVLAGGIEKVSKKMRVY